MYFQRDYFKVLRKYLLGTLFFACRLISCHNELFCIAPSIALQTHVRYFKNVIFSRTIGWSMSTSSTHLQCTYLVSLHSNPKFFGLIICLDVYFTQQFCLSHWKDHIFEQLTTWDTFLVCQTWYFHINSLTLQTAKVVS